jgi:hypothetical protein
MADLSPEVMALRKTLKAVHMATYRVGNDDIPAALRKVKGLVADLPDEPVSEREETKGRDRKERGGRTRAEE